MTITLHWWMWPIAFVLLGMAGAACVRERSGWDMGAALLKAASVVRGIGAAIGVLIGHYLS